MLLQRPLLVSVVQGTRLMSGTVEKERLRTEASKLKGSLEMQGARGC